MPKKQTKDDPKAQRERFEKAVQELTDAGELNPTDADATIERILTRVIPTKGGA